MLDECQDFLRRTTGPALVHALPGQLPQVTCRRHPFGHEFIGIFVTQFIKGKLNRIGDTQCFLKEFGRVNAFDHRARSKITLTVGIQGETCPVERARVCRWVRARDRGHSET